MVTVEEAQSIILSHSHDYGSAYVALEESLHRILAESVYADRDQPPFNRATMDGIAISYKNFMAGITEFAIKGIQAAGTLPLDVSGQDECIEIMTGAALSVTADTIIPYEDLRIDRNTATVVSGKIKSGQNIHYQGKDKKLGECILTSNKRISPQMISIMATVGMANVRVKKNPRIAIISTGDELVPISHKPSTFQIRVSNSALLKSCLASIKVPSEVFHYTDDKQTLRSGLLSRINTNDVLIITGGISMGKLDFVREVLSELGMKVEFNKVSQKPGKPFVFGTIGKTKTIFALPGNPVSACLCFYRYFLPWFQKCMDVEVQILYAQLSNTFVFKPELTFFSLVNLSVDEKGVTIAEPIYGNGSGDITSISTADAFMELPIERNTFEKGEVFRIWPLFR